VHRAQAANASRNDQFEKELEPHRRAITMYCYRMLGSLHEAEDVAQETLTRAWSRLGELRSHGAIRGWLYRIATNTCLNALKARRRRLLPHLIALPASAPAPLGAPLHDDQWIEPAPDSLLEVPARNELNPEARVILRESIGLAFIVALQNLSPKQRAVLLLIDVLGWQPSETAELLEASVVSVNSLLQRARSRMQSRARGAASSSRVQTEVDAALLRRYIETWESGDLESFAALLAEDAILSMPPQPEWFLGRESIYRFLQTVRPAYAGQYRLLPMRANGVPAFAAYKQRDVESTYRAATIMLVSATAGYITEIVRFAAPALFPSFGLPQELGRAGYERHSHQTSTSPVVL
jgi:RNA polymerase sigma-70 factor, ECF subfamily